MNGRAAWRWKARRLCLCLTYLLFLVASVESRMQDAKYKRLVEKVIANAPDFTTEEHYRLLFAALPVEEIGWDSPSSISQGKSTSFQGVTFNVILVHAPPLVAIQDPEAIKQGDPGNLNQTRTISNKQLRGFVIDLLSIIQDNLGCEYKFYYPCYQFAPGSNVTEDSVPEQYCSSDAYASVTSGLKMLDTARVDTDKYALAGFEELKEEQEKDDTLFYGGGPSLCPDNHCFVASNVKVTADAMRNCFMTQPFLHKGFALVVKTGDKEVDFFSWAMPFFTVVWVLTFGEIMVSTLAFMVTEGYGVGNSLSEFKNNPLQLLIESFQWSLFIFLGAASRQPVTHAGRTLVLANLFFVVLWISVYTGNLNQFLLNVPLSQDVESIRDFDPIHKTSKFSSRHDICVPAAQASVETYLQLLEKTYKNKMIPRVFGDDIADCLRMVYAGEATAAIYDEPVVLHLLAENYYSNGLCGPSGGLCEKTDAEARRKGGGGGPGESHLDGAGGGSHPAMAQEGCICPSKADDGSCINTENNVWRPFAFGDLITTGEIFNDVGYGLAFPRSPDSLSYVGFSQAILFLSEEGVLQELEQVWLVGADELACSGGENEDTMVLDVINVLGLFFVTGGLMILGFAVGTLEYLIRFSMLVMSCLFTCKSRIEAEIADAIEDAERELGEPEPTPHELFVDSVFDSLEEVQQVMQQIEKNLTKCVKISKKQ